MVMDIKMGMVTEEEAIHPIKDITTEYHVRRGNGSNRRHAEENRHRKVLHYHPPVMNFMKRCEDENEQASMHK